MYIRMFVSENVHMCVQMPLESRKGVESPGAGVTTWVLGPELHSFAGAVCTLKCRAIPPVPQHKFKIVCCSV